MVELGLLIYIYVIITGVIIQFNPPKWYEDLNERYWLSNPNRWKEGREWEEDGDKLKIWLAPTDDEQVFEEMKNTPGFEYFVSHGPISDTTYAQFTQR